MTQLFEPLQAGQLSLSNRVVMAPLTRNRAPGAMPNALMATYYSQRANPKDGAGLIITEATAISHQGQGYSDVPGIWSDAQVAAWKPTTESVHAAGGKIVMQLWHVGRVSHVDLQPGGQAPVAPSAITAKTKTVLIKDGVPQFQDTSAPRALELEELPGIVADYRRAARNAIAAGFDGVEVHGANGYLLDQFMRSGSNHRTDAYGGSIANRARLLVEVMQAVCDEIGAGKAALRAAYRAAGGQAAWMVNNAYDRSLADVALSEGADLVAFGRPFIANPDLTRRLREGAPLNAPDRATFYGGGAKGYIDYPILLN